MLAQQQVPRWCRHVILSCSRAHLAANCWQAAMKSASSRSETREPAVFSTESSTMLQVAIEQVVSAACAAHDGVLRRPVAGVCASLHLRWKNTAQLCICQSTDILHLSSLLQALRLQPPPRSSVLGPPCDL